MGLANRSGSHMFQLRNVAVQNRNTSKGSDHALGRSFLYKKQKKCGILKISQKSVSHKKRKGR